MAFVETPADSRMPTESRDDDVGVPLTMRPGARGGTGPIIFDPSDAWYGGRGESNYHDVDGPATLVGPAPGTRGGTGPIIFDPNDPWYGGRDGAGDQRAPVNAMSASSDGGAAPGAAPLALGGLVLLLLLL